MADTQTNVVNSSTTNTTENKSKKSSIPWLTIGISVFLLLAIAFIVFLYLRNKSLNRELVEEQTTTETIINEKTQLLREVKTLDERNRELMSSLDEAKLNLQAKEILILRLNEENETLKLIKSQLAEMQEINMDLKTSQDQIQALQDKISKTIDHREKQNQQFRDKLNK